MKPQIVQEIRDREGNLVRKIEPGAAGNFAETARQVMVFWNL